MRNVILITDPCIDCSVCKVYTQRVHVGNYGAPLPWSGADTTVRVRTYTGLPIELRFATAADLVAMLENSLFNLAPDLSPMPCLRETLTAFTSANRGEQNNIYPWIVLAIANEAIVGKLFLDPNPNNTIRRKGITIDSVIVAENFREQGISDAMITFTETIAKENQVRWIEIGVNSDNQRPLSNYIRKGYFKEPLYLNNPFRIYYQTESYFAQGANRNTVECGRYGNALVVYKDLNRNAQLPKRDREDLFRKLTSDIPQPAS